MRPGKKSHWGMAQRVLPAKAGKPLLQQQRAGLLFSRAEERRKQSSRETVIVQTKVLTV